MRVAVVGASGALGTAATSALGRLGAQPVGAGDAAEVRVLAAPAAAWSDTSDGPSVAGAVVQADADRDVDLPAAGWWGGLGTLVGAVAVEAADDPRELHVAYGLPGARRALGVVTPTLRTDLARLVLQPEPVARRDGATVGEPLGHGRRLAWFPQPVGPAHAVAVGGLEHLAPLDVPTVRTWWAAGATAAELLQALGGRDPDRGVGRFLRSRAAGGGAPGGATAEVRWAVVAEVRDGEDGVVRAWANGVDPVACAGALLACAATRLGSPPSPTPTGTVLDLGPPRELLDQLADLDVLRWSVARPRPARR